MLLLSDYRIPAQNLHSCWNNHNYTEMTVQILPVWMTPNTDTRHQSRVGPLLVSYKFRVWLIAVIMGQTKVFQKLTEQRALGLWWFSPSAASPRALSSSSCHFSDCPWSHCVRAHPSSVGLSIWWGIFVYRRYILVSSSSHLECFCQYVSTMTTLSETECFKKSTL